SPVLLIHGDDDRNVPFSETVDLVESLSRRGVDFEQLVFPDEVHGFLLHESWVAA
ncbi:MAG: prolyl oligopeptidase family serine peptidase, partial [Actinobacteria bacterium]|nr:prolyl oligopeptidase family serine peptidase [Actinomycetota bacterium]NIS28623.1 prolyl oligopeptidase family serine peptidase [Actinomycetota bacterium]NIT94056.1 prolyl oligopeptidase family serine peptidase [Actinomycetota bacterium]NIU64086.1 prolyl oligopeptidase family serine peptidase [Actinomycetota bacterium]NIV54192.1 prolyl oligopeptidase family serine peptidase [Actinomycetota bacterium]